MRQLLRLARSFPILAVLCVIFGASTAHAQRLLEEVQILEANGREILKFHFSSPYQGIPIEEHAAGKVELTFSATSSKVPERKLLATESKIIRDIRVLQNKYSTTVTLNLKNPSASLKGKLGFSNEKNLLRVSIGAKPGQPQAAPGVSARGVSAQKGSGQEPSLLSQMTRTIAGETRRTPAAGSEAAAAAQADLPKLGKYAGVDWWPTMLTLGLSLAAIIALLYLVMYLYKRLLGPRLGRLGEGLPIKQVSSFHIGPKQRIVVLDINGELVACGVTPNQISFLTRLGGGAAAQRRGAPARPPKPAPPGAAAAKPGAAQAAPSQPESRGGAGRERGRSASAPTPQADPVQQFADALKEKVSSLKRIK